MEAINAIPVESGVREADQDEPETTFGALLLEVPGDPTVTQTLRLVEQSGVLSFWDDPEEDIYTDDDGEPL